MSPTLPLPLLLLLLLLLPNPTTPSIYTLLQTHNLPTGLFPKNISNYTLNPTTNRFEFHLPSSSCDSKFETALRYESKVSGVIEMGRIGELKGMAAQELFLWLPVEEIKVDVPSTGLVYFDVGVVNKQFLASYFDDPVDCVVVSGAGGDEMVDVSFLKRTNRIVPNEPGKDMNEDYSGHELQAVS